MSSFDKKSSEKVNLESTSTNEYSNFNPVTSNIYLNCQLIHIDKTSEKLISTNYEVYIPSIDND